jgi:hypothetical protein
VPLKQRLFRRLLTLHFVFVKPFTTQRRARLLRPTTPGFVLFEFDASALARLARAVRRLIEEPLAVVRVPRLSR